ncbi:MAG: alanine racemase [Alphaproteobacteria bacterium]|nr:alanine racemase [Alphaproteobacteria bacterium]
MEFIKAIVDLCAIKRNYLKISELVGAVTTSVVLKSNAYGLGSIRVSQALYDVGCRYFWVAYLKEALALQKVLPADANLFYLQGFQKSDLQIIKNSNIVPVINSLHEFEQISKNNVAFALHVDTGLSRCGLRPEDIDRVLPALAYERVVCVLSHLACSDEKDNPMNSAQKNLFDELLAKIRTRTDTKASIAATGGTLLGREYFYDMVRIGSFLYRIQISTDMDAENVLTLETRVLQKYNLSAGHTVGYGATFTATRALKLAVVSIGYADGLKRSLSNKGIVGFYDEDRFYKAPIIGRISMDMTACDVSEIPDELTEPGATATILSEDYTVKDMAEDAGVIPSEILTGLNFSPERISRVYVE